MNLESFNHVTKQWDRFKEFYNEVNLINSRHYYQSPFVLMESGEFLVTNGYYKPRYRKTYDEFNVGIFNSDDYRWAQLLNHYKLTSPDGEPVKRSWLNHRGAQYLWVDFHSQTVHAIHPASRGSHNPLIPARFRGKAYLYYAAPNEQPISAGKLRVTNVDKLDTSEREHIKAIVAACKAWNTLSEEAKIPETHRSQWPHHAQIYTNGQYQPNQYYYPRPPAAVSALLQRDFATMTWAERKQVAMRGIKSRNITTHYKYLKLISK